MALRDFMERLLDDVGVPKKELKKPKPEVFMIEVDPETRITISNVEEGFFFHGTVAPPPSDNREVLFEELLEGNLFAKGTFGSTMGLTEDSQMLTLTEMVSPEVSYDEFRDKFEDFLNTVKYWQSFAKK